MNEIEDAVPYLFFRFSDLLEMTKEQIIQAIEPALKERGCFLVEVSLSADNDIEIVIEKSEGSVDWDDCAALDKVMHECFNQDQEDYALTVSSAGLDRPFKVPAQYLKAIGTRVDVWLKGGKKLKGILEAYGEEGIKVEGIEIPCAQINSVRPLIDFK